MSRYPDGPHRRRPSYFWWTLINLLALTFAVLSWTGCYFVFNFPERPWNYEFIKKLNRLPEISFFESSNLPKATTLPPKQLYGLIYDRTPEGKPQVPQLLDLKTLQKLNIQLKRNYITNFKEPHNLNYVRGTWRIISVRTLTENDFVTQGFAILSEALAIPEEQENSTNPQLFPFPVEVEIIIPTAEGVEIPKSTVIEKDNSFELTKLPHALAIIHISQSGTTDEPVSRITTIPLLKKDFPLTKKTSLPLTPPVELNPKGVFPLFVNTSEG